MDIWIYGLEIDLYKRDFWKSGEFGLSFRWAAYQGFEMSVDTKVESKHGELKGMK